MALDLSSVIAELSGLTPGQQAEFAREAQAGTKGMLGIPLPGPQTAAYHSQADVLLYGGSAGSAKALALDTPLPTPDGWTTMGAACVGDVLMSEAGEPCHVVAVTPVMIGRPCYRLTFSDGATIVADAWHQWLTSTSPERLRELKATDAWRAKRKADRPSRVGGKKSAAFTAAISARNAANAKARDLPTSGIRTTQEIADTIRAHRGGRLNHSVGLAQPLLLPDAKLPIDPYLLGAWLGDGTSAGARICMAEQGMVDAVSAACEAHGWKVNKGASRYDYGIVGGLKVKLREADVLGAKCVPPIYLRGSVNQRLALVQGLMDTDGTVNPSGSCSFTNTNRKIIDGLHELLASLGVQSQIREGQAKLYGRVIGLSYRLQFTTGLPVFKLERKLSRQRNAKMRDTTRRRYIVSAELIPSVPVKCVEVDSPSHMYLAAREMVPTHNSALLILLAANEHQRSIIFRRESSQTDGLIAFGKEVIGGAARYNGTDLEWTWPEGRTIKLAGMQLPDDWRKHAGRERDLIGFDEAGEFLEAQVSSIMAWLRAEPGRRCRVVMASNPPRGNDGAWLLEWFAPWLDPQFANRAQPGELRWCVRWRGQTVWVDGPGEHLIEGEAYTATSRTFIPAALADNPYRNTPEYRAKLQSLDEPLRSQLLYGDFGAGQGDDEWQAIPTQWVREAMNRWTSAPPYGVPMCSIGVDVAQGGADNTVLAPRYDAWFAPLIVVPGVQTPSGTEVAGLVAARMRNSAKIIIDVGGGFGADAHGHLKGNEVDSYPFMGLKSSSARTENGQHTFSNLRTQAWWRLREALNPDQPGGSPVFLPDDRDLMRDLVAPRYKYGKGDSEIELEPKDKLVKRLGRSPDRGDAVAMAWFSGAKMASDHAAWKSTSRRGVNMPTVQPGRKLLTARR